MVTDLGGHHEASSSQPWRAFGDRLVVAEDCNDGNREAIHLRQCALRHLLHLSRRGIQHHRSRAGEWRREQWSAHDGASLICSGINNIDNDTPKSFVADEKATTGPGCKITYSKTGKNWAVLSGVKGDKVFYERRLFGKDGVIRTVWIKYPSSLKAKYDALTGAIATSLCGP